MRKKALAIIVALTAGVLMSIGPYIANIYRQSPQSIIVSAADDSAWPWTRECVECTSYVVQPGDTLWGIANKHYPGEITEKTVWTLREVNDLLGPGGPILQPGQEIWIPDPEQYGR
jgi:nucleoid-associated protein YgaU